MASFLAPGHVLIREASKDTVINVPKPVGQEGTIPIPIPKGFQVSSSTTRCRGCC